MFILPDTFFKNRSRVNAPGKKKFGVSDNSFDLRNHFRTNITLKWITNIVCYKSTNHNILYLHLSHREFNTLSVSLSVCLVCLSPSLPPSIHLSIPPSLPSSLSLSLFSLSLSVSLTLILRDKHCHTLEICFLPWRSQGHIQCFSLFVQIDIHRNMSADLRLRSVERKMQDVALGSLELNTGGFVTFWVYLSPYM